MPFPPHWTVFYFFPFCMPNKGLFFSCLVSAFGPENITNRAIRPKWSQQIHCSLWRAGPSCSQSLCLMRTSSGSRPKSKWRQRNCEKYWFLPTCALLLGDNKNSDRVASNYIHSTTRLCFFLSLLLTRTSLEPSHRHLFSGILLGSHYFLLVPDRVVVLAFPAECLGKSGPALLLGCISGSRHAHCCLRVCGQSFSSSSYEEEAAKAKGTGKPAGGEPVQGSKQI